MTTPSQDSLRAPGAEETATPRTDKAEARLEMQVSGAPLVVGEFARMLERELFAANKKLEAWRKCAEELAWAVQGGTFRPSLAETALQSLSQLQSK